MPAKRDHAQLYRLIKITGMATFIPVILLVGPLAGYYAGQYLENRVGGSPYIAYALGIFGFIGAVRETMRIIRMMGNTEKKD